MKIKINEVVIIKKIFFSRLFLFLVLISISLYSLTIGVKGFSAAGLFSGQRNDMEIALLSRIPRLLSIAVTGASLSIAGIIMQTVTNNKFVSPSTTGIMDWAKFGIMISLIFFGDKSTFFKMTAAFIFTLLGTLLFMKILNRIQFKNSVLIPLIGIMLGSIVNSVTGFFSYRFDIIQNINSWLQGSFSLVIKGRYELLYLGMPFLVIAYIYADRFTIAGMGESFSVNLGLNYEKVVLTGLVIVAVITSTIVVTIGSIPFVGLIVPNIVSIYKGDNMKNSLPDTALLGVLFVLICDIFGRVIIFPYEVSVSVVISVVGSIIFLFILFRRYRYAG